MHLFPRCEYWLANYEVLAPEHKPMGKDVGLRVLAGQGTRHGRIALSDREPSIVNGGRARVISEEQ